MVSKILISSTAAATEAPIHDARQAQPTHRRPRPGRLGLGPQQGRGPALQARRRSRRRGRSLLHRGRRRRCRPEERRVVRVYLRHDGGRAQGGIDASHAKPPTEDRSYSAKICGNQERIQLETSRSYRQAAG